ncbi:MAG TPA: AsmA-like C-terminal region-containing protein [Flavitalea sp.]|nr:AsmA-like C-terminal region-containing protein [Flavitalea sp.]
MKKFLRILAITIGVILILLFTIPILFRDKIIALAKQQINQTINAKAEFSDASVSFFRHFPKLSLALDNLSVSGIAGFEQDTLLSAKQASIALNVMSVLKGENIKVSSVVVNEPVVYATVNKEGKANWDIVKADSTAADTAASKPFNLNLQNYEITNATIYYVDSTAGTEARIFGLDHSGSGDFTQDEFTLKTRTSAKEVTYAMNGIPWLSKANLSANTDIQVNNAISKYSFATENIRLNELPLAVNGFYQIIDDSTADMDINFKSSSADFKNILSLIPVVYQKDFKSLEAKGQASFDGFVKGRMQGERLPAYDIKAAITNGYFKYQDLPAPVKNIQMQLHVNNPDGVNDHLVFAIPSAHLEMNGQPVDMRFLLKNPETSRFVDASVKGSLQLADVRNFIKLEKGTDLKGTLDADVNVKGSLRNANAANADKFYAAGSLLLNNFFYKDNDYPSGITINKLAGTFSPEETIIRDVSGKYLSSGFSANGQLFNFFQYMFDKSPLNAAFNLKADQLLVSDFMTDSGTADAAKPAEVFLVPANMNVKLNAAADKVVYENLTINDVSGTMILNDETLRFDNLQGKALEGTLLINGNYSTKSSKSKPVIGLQYAIKNMDVQKTFLTFNTVQKLMPIGKWLGGKLNSELTLSGNLGRDLMPDLQSLTGNGNLFLIEGLLEKFKPLEQLAAKINVEELKQVSLREVRQYFEFTNGKVLVKPFNLNYKDIKMEIGGSHGFDQSLNYVINMVIPRARFGTDGNRIVDDLLAQAMAKGIPVKASETVNLKVNLTGFINEPIFKIDLKEAASSLKDEITQQAKEFAKARVDSAKQVVKDTLQELRKEIFRDASEELKKQIFSKKDSTVSTDTARKTRSQDRVKEAGKGILDKINPLKKPKAADTTQKKGS